MVICRERGAHLHMAQLVPLQLTVSCCSKIQIGFTFLVLAYLDKGPLNVCVCVCVCACVRACLSFKIFCNDVSSIHSGVKNEFEVGNATWLKCHAESGKY